MSETQIALLAVAAFAVVFPLMWLSIMWVNSQFGWARLAAEYPASAEPVGVRYTGVSVGLNWIAQYRSVITAHVSADGIWLRPMVLFAFAHPPVFIPWSAVEWVGEGTFGGARLHLKNGRAVSVTALGRTGREIRELAREAVHGAAG